MDVNDDLPFTINKKRPWAVLVRAKQLAHKHLFIIWTPLNSHFYKWVLFMSVCKHFE